MVKLVILKAQLSILIIIFFCFRISLNDPIPIKNKNFDIREIGKTFHKPIDMKKYEAETSSEYCNSNLPLQISSLISDTVYPTNEKKVVSPMNSITCFKQGYDCSVKYSKLEDLKNDMDLLIDFYNTKGAQLYDSYEYKFDKLTGKFPQCINDFTNEVEFFSQKKRIKLVTLDKNPDVIKLRMFNYGSILGVFYADDTFLSYGGGIYHPDNTKEKDSYYVIRLIGWRTLDNKLYWVFAFTIDFKWGIGGYGLVEKDAIDLTFYDIQEDTNNSD